MELLTQEGRKRLPTIGATEHDNDPVVQLKFFTPDSCFTWFVLEYDGKDTFFGLVEGLETEMGYFSLGELKSVKGPLGLPVERDLYFQPKPLSAVKRECRP